MNAYIPLEELNVRNKVLFAGLLLGAAGLAGCSAEGSTAAATEEKAQAEITQLENEQVKLKQQNEDLQKENEALKEKSKRDQEKLLNAHLMAVDFVKGMATGDVDLLKGLVGRKVSVSEHRFLIGDEKIENVESYEFGHLQKEEFQDVYENLTPYTFAFEEETLNISYFIEYDDPYGDRSHIIMYIDFAENEEGDLKIVNVVDDV